jgi:hypothetical protein
MLGREVNNLWLMSKLGQLHRKQMVDDVRRSQSPKEEDLRWAGDREVVFPLKLEIVTKV